MEKINAGLKFIGLLGTVLALLGFLLGFVEIQSYRTVDMDLARNSKRSVKDTGGIHGLNFSPHWVAQETLFQTNYRIKLNF